MAVVNKGYADVEIGAATDAEVSGVIDVGARGTADGETMFETVCVNLLVGIGCAVTLVKLVR